MSIYTAITGLSVAFSLIAISVSIYTFRVQRTDTSYADIDQAYSNLLQIALMEPGFRNYERTAQYHKLDGQEEFRLKYETYAYMVWNLLETIFNRQRARGGRYHLSPTWVPVIIEENRLHYTWFKHNLRLFKSGFQKIVTEDLNDIDVVEGQLADLDQVFQRFEKDFPSAERMERTHLKLLLSKGRYRLLLAKHRVFDALIGYAFVYEPENPAMIWLDYMAIDERFQSAGYGTLLFHKLALRRPDGMGVFLEVEIADSPDPTTRREQERRIAFYQRLGAHILQLPYRLPTEADSLPMHLVFWPSPGIHILPQDQIESAVATAYDYIHSDIPHRDVVLKSFLSTIHDAHF